MIINCYQVCLAKLSGCGLQEVTHAMQLKFHRSSTAKYLASRETSFSKGFIVDMLMIFVTLREKNHRMGNMAIN